MNSCLSFSFLTLSLFTSPHLKKWNLRRPRFDPWVRKIPWRREWQPTPVFLPGEFHEQRSLAGYSPWGHKELDTSELLTYYVSLIIREMQIKTTMKYHLTLIRKSSSKNLQAINTGDCREKGTFLHCWWECKLV